MKINNKKGFTLIELMVVIAIIGILATAGITQYTQYQAKSRDAVRVQTLSTIETSLASYYNDFGKFPQAVDTHCLSKDTGEVSTESGKEFTTYFPGGKAPLDPQATNKSGGCQTVRSYGYKPLKNNGLDENGYYIVTNVEGVKEANTVWSSNLTSLTEISENTKTTVSEIGKYTKGTVPSSTAAESSVFAKIN